jgi:glycosyltransferase involved in cell wall biosynthesis
MAHRGLVLIPSYNAGPQLLLTVRQALAAWQPVWVVIDGSTDGSENAVLDLAASEPNLRVEVLPANRGKGEAIRHGAAQAVASGFTHVLTMDSDGQHPATLIPSFMQASRDAPGAMILGVPVFDADAPAIRVQGRRISNALVAVQTLGAGIGDCLFGFRVYPAAALLAVMARTPWMRRFDFDAEAVVRLAWRGTPVVNLPAPVRYLDRAEGGISHFRYGRDNVLLAWMHLRLLWGGAIRAPFLLFRRRD